jgi:hypothetical protein
LIIFILIYFHIQKTKHFNRKFKVNKKVWVVILIASRSNYETAEHTLLRKMVKWSFELKISFTPNNANANANVLVVVFVALTKRAWKSALSHCWTNWRVSWENEEKTKTTLSKSYYTVLPICQRQNCTWMLSNNIFYWFREHTLRKSLFFNQTFCFS